MTGHGAPRVFRVVPITIGISLQGCASLLGGQAGGLLNGIFQQGESGRGVGTVPVPGSHRHFLCPMPSCGMGLFRGLPRLQLPCCKMEKQCPPSLSWGLAWTSQGTEHRALSLRSLSPPKDVSQQEQKWQQLLRAGG